MLVIVVAERIMCSRCKEVDGGQLKWAIDKSKRSVKEMMSTELITWIKLAAKAESRSRHSQPLSQLKLATTLQPYPLCWSPPLVKIWRKSRNAKSSSLQLRQRDEACEIKTVKS